VSARLVSRRAHLPWLAPRECKPPTRTDRSIWLVGKQTTSSNRGILAATSLPTEWSLGFGRFHDASSCPSLPLQRAYLGGLPGANKTRSGLVCLLRNRSNTTTCLCPSKFSCCHDLPIVSGFRGLTSETAKRYIQVRRGRSRRSGLSKIPNGPVEGLSPEILESAA
jgi:hypothetical protein